MSSTMVKIGFILDPIESLNVEKDTSLTMMMAAQDRGWELIYLTQQSLTLHLNTVIAETQQVSIDLDASPFYQLGPKQVTDLSELAAIFMRVDPPFDMNYIYSTYLLERLERKGVQIINPPQALRDSNEKLFATEFGSCCPPLIVSSNKEQLKAFYQEHQDVIFKPLDGMGGSSIFRAKEGEHNLSVMLEVLTDLGDRPIMGQQYLPEISDGDKRILLVDGEAIPYSLARIPSVGETRGNLAAGGKGEVRELTDRDRWIVAQIQDQVRARGLLFVGIDVIGDYLTEINVTSPTCVREIDRDAGTNIGATLMSALAKRI